MGRIRLLRIVGSYERAAQILSIAMIITKKILIAGIPATGKSKFGKFLADSGNFLHIDLEKVGELEKYGLRDDWNSFCNTKDPSKFINSIKSKNKAVVLDWGFPSNCLWIIKELKKWGFELWWFDGDLTKALEKFQKRGGVPFSCFEIQVKEIMDNWREIEAVLDGKSIKVLDENGKVLDHKEIFQKIFGQ